MATVNIEQFTENLLDKLNPNQRRVIIDRFGLNNGKKTTLQAIGNDLGITRERVRQIEEQAINFLKPAIQENGVSILEEAQNYLVNVGGVRRDDHFITDLGNIWFYKKEVKFYPQILRFIFLVGEKPFYYKEDEHYHNFWFNSESSREKFFNLIKKIFNFFEKADKKSILEQKNYLLSYSEQPVALGNFLAIHKHFGVNVFGDIGLKFWPEIEPKTIRDKAYLILKKENQPLHFAEIANFINHHGLGKRKAHVPTVHNELIKDERFVLVGRGLYALKEAGFEPGTVKTVISRLLKQKGPLTSKEIKELVSRHRLVKDSTILVNLQNKDSFRRLEDGRYALKKN